MIKQRQQNDCGITAIANGMGWSYAKAKRLTGNAGKGLTNNHLKELLVDLDWKIQTARKKPELENWIAKHKKGTYIVSLFDVSVLWSGDGHAIAVIDGNPVGDNLNNKWFVSWFAKKQ